MGMSEEYQYQLERDNESGIADCEAYYAQQMALPAHKRDGYAERAALEAKYTEARECCNPF